MAWCLAEVADQDRVTGVGAFGRGKLAVREPRVVVDDAVGVVSELHEVRAVEIYLPKIADVVDGVEVADGFVAGHPCGASGGVGQLESAEDFGIFGIHNPGSVNTAGFVKIRHHGPVALPGGKAVIGLKGRNLCGCATGDRDTIQVDVAPFDVRIPDILRVNEVWAEVAIAEGKLMGG
jgi:hypothetical protein